MNLASPDHRIRLDQDDTTGTITARCSQFGHLLGGTWPDRRDTVTIWRLELPAYVEPYLDVAELGYFGVYPDDEIPHRHDAITTLCRVVAHYLDHDPRLGGYTSTEITHALIYAGEALSGDPDPASAWSQETEDDLTDHLTLVRKAIAYVTATNQQQEASA